MLSEILFYVAGCMSACALGVILGAGLVSRRGAGAQRKNKNLKIFSPRLSGSAGGNR